MIDFEDVRDNRDEGRFELLHNGVLAVAEYQLRGDVLVFTHTLVPPEISGQGVATALVGGALDLVRAEGRKVVSHCAFVTRYMEEHPAARDLLAIGE